MEIKDLSLIPAISFNTAGEKSEGRPGLEKVSWVPKPSHPWPLYIMQAGSSDWRTGNFWRRINAQHLQIEMIIAGNMIIRQNGREYFAGKGDVYLLHQRSEHLYTVGSMGFARKRFVMIDGSALSAIVAGTGLAGVHLLTPQDPWPLARVMREASDFAYKKPRDFAKRLSLLAYELLNELVACSRAPFSSPVKAALDYMTGDISIRPTNENIARAAGVSIRYLSRLFMRELETTPQRYAIAYRLAFAKHLLQSTALPVKEIADRIGFEDQLYFSKVFRKAFGASPRAFRKQGRLQS